MPTTQRSEFINQYSRTTKIKLFHLKSIPWEKFIKYSLTTIISVNFHQQNIYLNSTHLKLCHEIKLMNKQPIF